MTDKFWKTLKISHEILATKKNKETARLNLLALKDHWIVRNMMSTIQEIAFSFSFSAKQ